MFRGTDLHPNQEVFDARGEKFGEVSEVTDRYFRVATGFLDLGTELYVPYSAIDRIEGNRIYVSPTKDQIDSLGWDELPPQIEAIPMHESILYGTMPTGGVAEREAASAALPAQLAGYSIWDRDGREIGEVYDEGPRFMHVRAGMFAQGRDLYIPKAEINRCEANRCFLRTTSDEVFSRGWDQEPAGWQPGESGPTKPEIDSPEIVRVETTNREGDQSA